MASFTVVVTDQVFPSVDLEKELLAGIGAELVVATGGPEQVSDLARDADALLNTYMPIDATFVAQLHKCRVIARYGIGIDNIDVAAAAAAGIVVTNVPDYCVEEVAAHTVALTLAHLRKVVAGDAAVREGRWGIGDLRPIRRLSELTVGLVGYGRIGMRVAAAFEVLGARVAVFDPYLPNDVHAERVDDLKTLVSRSDVVSLHLPLTAATRGVVGADQLTWFAPNALLVNTSRGALVDVDAVLSALSSGALGGAALDVFDTEPLDPARIDGVPNLLVTPHMAYYSESALRESQRKAASQIVKVLTGTQPDYPVGIA